MTRLDFARNAVKDLCRSTIAQRIILDRPDGEVPRPRRPACGIAAVLTRIHSAGPDVPGDRPAMARLVDDRKVRPVPQCPHAPRGPARPCLRAYRAAQRRRRGRAPTCRTVYTECRQLACVDDHSGEPGGGGYARESGGKAAHLALGPCRIRHRPGRHAADDWGAAAGRGAGRGVPPRGPFRGRAGAAQPAC